MLIVVSSPACIPREAEWINRLFDAGLEVLHMRKPDADEATLTTLLRALDPQYLNRLAWHQQHDLGAAWGMQRIHLTSSARHHIPSTQLEHMRASGKTISTSIHSHQEYAALPEAFHYALLGPVFPSISKPGYQPASPVQAPVRGPQATKVIAIGGVAPRRCHDVSAAGFDGVAVLGSIWQHGNPLENFKQMQEAWYIHDRL